MDLRQQLGVETPEHVEVHLELAGVGSRTAAAFFDTGVLNLGVILIVVGARTIGTGLSRASEGWLRSGRAADGGRGPGGRRRSPGWGRSWGGGGGFSGRGVPGG